MSESVVKRGAHPFNDDDARYAYELVRDMASKLTRVWAGSTQEQVAADYVVAELKRNGLSPRVDFLHGHISHPGEGTLLVNGSEGGTESIVCAVMAQTETTSGLTAEPVYVGSGGFDDYEGHDVRGKIVVVDLTYTPPRPEKMRIAKAMGAAGMVMINWGRDSDDSIPYGTTKYVWGNPTRQTAEDMVTLPGVGISRPSGNRLLKRIENEPGLTLTISSEAERLWRELRLPSAWIGEGPESDREFVLVAGHYDNWIGGATDNLSGDGALLAMARYFGAIKDRLKRDIVVAWWPAHESGIMIGSTWYADSHWRLLRDRCVGYVNVDQLGMGEYTRWYVETAAELAPMIEAETPPQEIVWGRPHKYGDQSFFGLGIPSTNCFHGSTEEQKRASNGMTLGWWYHSEFDTIDKVNPETHAEGLRLNTRYIEQLATSEVLPYRLTSVAAEIEQRMDELESQATQLGWNPADSEYPWRAVRDEARSFARAAESFDRRAKAATAEDAAAANHALRAVARITVPVRYSATHRYDQDSYGQSRLPFVLPELQVILDRARATGDEVHFLDAELYRALNRLSDALVDALEVITAA